MLSDLLRPRSEITEMLLPNLTQIRKYPPPPPPQLVWIRGLYKIHLGEPFHIELNAEICYLGPFEHIWWDTRPRYKWGVNEWAKGPSEWVIYCCQHDVLFLTSHCDVTTINMWRKINTKDCYCDVILVDCRLFDWSSLVNNNREYSFPSTRYSRYSV